MKYRDFLSLTDEEIEFAVKNIFEAEKVENIERDEECEEITCDITTGGWSDGETEGFSITDVLTLKEPTLSDCGIQVDFSVGGAEMKKWRQFCLAKGCNAYLKNNPYLEYDSDDDLTEIYNEVAKEMNINFKTGFIIDDFETDICITSENYYDFSNEEIEECIMDWIHSYKDTFLYNVISKIHPEILSNEDDAEKYYEEYYDGCFNYLIKRALGS